MSKSDPHVDASIPVAGEYTFSEPAPEGLFEGFVLADKPRGLGSAALVGRLKHELKRRAAAAGAPRKIKVGHTGTLDRFASGLMLLLTGRATALADQFLHADKAYVGRFQFGAFTDTHDSQGEIIESVTPAEAQRFLKSEGARIRRTILALAEVTRQQPPLYSALKQDGRRFSDRARSGETELPAERDIRVYDVDLKLWHAEAAAVDIDLHVSGGTYIRAFARDLSRELDFPIHLAELRRYRLGRHVLPNTDADRSALPPERLISGQGDTPAGEGRVWRPVFLENPGPEKTRDTSQVEEASCVIRDVRGALPEWPRLAVAPGEAPNIIQGRTVSSADLPAEPGTDFFIEVAAAAAGDAGRLLAWGRTIRPGAYKYMRVFG
ncbi:MAG: hypothetical protein NXI24_13880 [bacterium]|nr:hypothetical protein [bacterium]